MNLSKTIICLIVCLCCLNQSSQAQTTEFTYQGSLQNSSAPASGNFDFEFLLYDALSGGTQLGATLTRSTVAVAAGTFAVKLDFGSHFPGANRFLQIHVRPTGGGAYTPLAPRQAVNSAPYSVKSLNTDQLGGVAANQYVTTTGGGANFIQNTTAPQSSSNFNISGTGTANILNAVTQFNIGGGRILYNPGTNNLFAGIGAGPASTPIGSNNSFFGTSAGSSAPSLRGSNNAVFGYNAQVSELPGGNVSGNSLFGSGTYGGVSSSEITLIGFAAMATPGQPKVNSTAIGARSQVEASNSLVLGSINGINGATADTNVGIGTTAPATRLHVVGNVGVTGNLGIGTTNPNTKLQVAGGSVYIQQPNSLIITSPNGACWFITVNDAGALSTNSVTCP